MELEVRSRGELISKLQEVTLRGGNTQPYQNARIDLVTLDPAILAPTQRYVLTKELKKIEQVRWRILEDHNQDILNLDGYVKCIYPCSVRLDDGTEVKGNPKIIDVIPPVVEEYFDPKGKLHLIVADGQHRCYLAYTSGHFITVAYVRGIHWGYPYYAFPLPNGWDDVEVRDDIPEGYIKKFHVAREHKKLYRNFNSQFENIGDSRPYSAPTDSRVASYHQGVGAAVDPEFEKARLKEERLDMLKGSIPVIGSPYEKSSVTTPFKIKIDEATIKALREKTGMGMYDCREALEQAGGDLDAAFEIMRKWGSSPA